MRHLKGQPEPPKQTRKGSGRKKGVVKVDPKEVHPEFAKFANGDWISAPVISQMLPVYSVGMVYYYARQNRMPFPMVKIGKVWYAKKDEVEKYIKSLYDEASSDPNHS